MTPTAQQVLNKLIGPRWSEPFSGRDEAQFLGRYRYYDLWYHMKLKRVVVETEKTYTHWATPDQHIDQLSTTENVAAQRAFILAKQLGLIE